MSKKYNFPSIFEFSDYRIYQKKAYEQGKSVDSHFSHRYIAAKVGFKSPSHFSQIIAEKFHISQVHFSGFCELLALKKRERDYFQSMVFFGQSKSHSEQRKYFNQMMSFKEATVSHVSCSQYEFYKKWYFGAIRELLQIIDFDGNDFEKLAKLLVPKVSVSQAKKAFEVLIELRLIKKEGEFYKSENNAIIIRLAQ